VSPVLQTAENLTCLYQRMEPAPKKLLTAAGQCLRGRVRLEIDVPARWAWHDHSAASRLAHGAAYATYVGSWRSRFRIVEGKDGIRRFKDMATGATRSFCTCCGSPLMPFGARWVRRQGCHFYFARRVTFQTCADSLYARYADDTPQKIESMTSKVARFVTRARCSVPKGTTKSCPDRISCVPYSVSM
jgi:hypothetical protein